MPFINISTNVKTSPEKNAVLKQRLGSAIEILGKTESWLMIEIDDRRSMYFKGSDVPLVFADVSVFGHSTDDQCEKMTEEMCKIFNEELSVSPDRVYVKYSGTNQWGWNNMNL